MSAVSVSMLFWVLPRRKVTKRKYFLFCPWRCSQDNVKYRLYLTREEMLETELYFRNWIAQNNMLHLRRPDFVVVRLGLIVSVVSSWRPNWFQVVCMCICVTWCAGVYAHFVWQYTREKKLNNYHDNHVPLGGGIHRPPPPPPGETTGRSLRPVISRSCARDLCGKTGSEDLIWGWAKTEKHAKR